MIKNNCHCDYATTYASIWDGYIEATENPKTKNLEKEDKSEGEEKVIPFDLNEAKDTGIFVCGTSQSGKSTLFKTHC